MITSKKRNVENTEINIFKKEGDGKDEIDEIKTEKKPKVSAPIELLEKNEIEEENNNNELCNEIVAFNSELISLDDRHQFDLIHFIEDVDDEEESYIPNIPFPFLPLLGRRGGTMFFNCKFADNIDIEGYSPNNLIIEFMSENLSLFLGTSPKQAAGKRLSTFSKKTPDSFWKIFSRVRIRTKISIVFT